MKDEPLFQRMYGVCADALTLATQLSQAPDLPSPEILRQRINAAFENLRRKAQQEDIPSADAMEAIYAIAAFMDEQILRSPWPARQQWMAMPLQLAYFQVNDAGEGFFQRLAGLEVDPSRYHVVEIYYLCLALGFQGKYAVGHAHEWAQLLERISNDLSRRLPPSAPICPNVYPARSALGFSRKRFPALGAALGFLALSVVLFLGLKLVLGLSAGGAAERIVADSGVASAVGGKK
jgi:type VI secretion system protein ImpK